MSVARGTCCVAHNIWFVRNHYIHKVMNKNNEVLWQVYNKYDTKKKRLKDFSFEATGISHVMKALTIFSEDIDLPIVPELIPDDMVSDDDAGE